MSLKIGWYKTPVPEGREDKHLPHARIISQGTLDTKYLSKIISETSTISSADIKGVLEALTYWMGFYLGEGKSINLEGLGHFSPTIKSLISTDTKGNDKVTAHVDTVAFRCSTELKEKLRDAGLEEMKRIEKEIPESDIRMENIQAYVNKNISINSSAAMKLNNCNRHLALHDLNLLVENGKLIQTGNGKQTVYIRPYK